MAPSAATFPPSSPTKTPLPSPPYTSTSTMSLPPAQTPLAPKTLTMSTIRSAVPSHCFQRSLLHSLRYLLTDLLLISLIFLTTYILDPYIPEGPLKLILWANYIFWQGAVMTGVWVLAHECGHQSFSPWKKVNDAFGLVLHSLLLVPYHSWRITHGMHHKHTNHMKGDQVFVPIEKSEFEMSKNGGGLWNAIEESPLGDLMGVVRMLLFGWPAYLMWNIAGQKYVEEKEKASHFSPKAPMFDEKDWWDIVVSDVGLVSVFMGLGVCCKVFGWWNVCCYYVMPYLVVNAWLVLITYMQHSDPKVPHYKPEEWTFIRGALCSVDRDYGIFNVLHHHIGDTHVAHHMFSRMPFYHAQEATKCIKAVLGKYYQADDTPIVKALFRSWAKCKYVDPQDGGVMFFKNGEEGKEL